MKTIVFHLLTSRRAYLDLLPRSSGSVGEGHPCDCARSVSRRRDARPQQARPGGQLRPNRAEGLDFGWVGFGE